MLRRLDDPAQREELVRQCTFCHQQGNWATRRVRDPEEWRKVLHLMGRMGGMVSADLREKLPALFNEAYAPETAVAALTAGMGSPDFAPPPPPEVRRTVIEEWDLGGRASMQHDLTVHPDGRIYSVDMSQDQLYRLDPATGARAAWPIPRGDLPLGGVFATSGPPDNPSSNAHVGPHSLQVAPDGSLWITLALGNQLARFDPATESFTTVQLARGYYPHTLRFDSRGRIWYTIAGSNHLGMWDPGGGRGPRAAAAGAHARPGGGDARDAARALDRAPLRPARRARPTATASPRRSRTASTSRPTARSGSASSTSTGSAASIPTTSRSR